MNNKQLKQDHFKVSSKKDEEEQYLSGRGAQFNTQNRFLKTHQIKEEIESIDDWEVSNPGTQYIEQQVKSIVNKVDSPDL